MSPDRFEHLVNLVGPFIAKQDTKLRKAITVQECLVLTLRYLATGDSQQSQSFNFCIGRATVCHIINETCDGIWNALQETYLKSPSTIENWKSIAAGFETKWNFPHCLGALDGKHVAIDCPKNAGSIFYNYKGFHSLVLMAICDSNYCFLLVDIGGYGHDNDASLFSQSDIGISLNNSRMNIPDPEFVHDRLLPYVLVSDEIFPLKPWLMKPYSAKNLDEKKLIYNYRLSRSRRTIENAFGILSARWRIFRRPIRANPSTVEKIIKATVCLHNYLRLTDNAYYSPEGFIDSYDGTGCIKLGDWRTIVSNDAGLQRFSRTGSNNYSAAAQDIRESFEKYFNSCIGALEWQNNHVHSCGETI